MQAVVQQNKVTTIFITICFSLTLFVFAPNNLYLRNSSEFSLLFKEVLFYTLSFALLFSIIVIKILESLKSSLRQKVVSLLMALSVLLWLQGNILVWQYGPLDGGEIHWGVYWKQGLIDSSLWFLLIVFALIKSPFLYRFARRTAEVVILLQFLSVSILAVQTQEEPLNPKDYCVDETSKFHFSKQKNVIIIILDEFQSDIFQEIITQEEKYKNIFDGFTYFRNALAGYGFTELSIPAMLTGQFYDNSIARGEFLRNAYLNNGVPKLLKEHGFQVELFPVVRTTNAVFFDDRVAVNFKRCTISIKDKMIDMLRLSDLALFRYLPHFAKKYIYNNQEWFIYRLSKETYSVLKSKLFSESRKQRGRTFAEKEFIDKAFLQARFDKNEKIFRYYFLKGMHAPLRVNENFEMSHTPIPYNRNNYIQQAKASLKICEMFFDILKHGGVYDNSLIMIMGDHGSGRSKDMHVRPVYDSRTEMLNRTAPRKNFQLTKARGIPLVLVKRFNEGGTMKTSDAPVSLIDVTATIMRELKISGNFPGVSMFEVKEVDNRKRYYGGYEWSGEKGDFVAPITMYVVEGFSWSDKSWKVQTILPPHPLERPLNLKN